MNVYGGDFTASLLVYKARANKLTDSEREIGGEERKEHGSTTGDYVLFYNSW